jgi:hypothetical protein
MADNADCAQLEIEAELARARRAAQARLKLIPSGHCHNCDEQVKHAGQLFCDLDCARDFEKRERGLVLRGD